METMNAEQAVKLIHPTAKFFIWSDGPCGWVGGAEWETKICADADRAWFVAMEMIGSAVAA